MLLDEKKKRLFDTAYEAYLNITGVLETLQRDSEKNLFAEGETTVTDLVCSLDLFLQGILIRIAAVDASFTEEELHFILSLPDELEEVCARNRGYRRYLRNLSMESYTANASRYFDESRYPDFLKIIREKEDDAADRVISSVEIILNSFAAIDDNVSEAENEVITKTLAFLRSDRGSSKSQAQCLQREKNRGISNGTDTQAEELDDVLSELNALIGLESVKRDVLSCINLLKINKIRQEKGLPELQISRHMVFTGQPGTGKTTVARIMARVYKALGVVSKGQLVETDRSGMVAGYVGQTALKTAQVIQRAKGGVLFIDEAYALTSDEGSNDFGKEAIDTLVKGMEDYRDDLVVIVAGYTEEMTKFIHMNPGLRSRFNKYIHFDNYQDEEMLEIFKRLCEKAQFILSGGAEEKALEYFKIHQGDESFGNARGVRNYYEQVVTAQANRIVSLKTTSEEEFRSILPEDVF